MSDPATTNNADAGEALARMATYGKKEKNGSWGKLVLVIVLLIPLAAVAWVAWRQEGLRSELTALRADNAALQQSSASSASQFAQVQQRQQELEATLEQTPALQQELAASNAVLATQSGELDALRSTVTALRNELAAVRADAAATRQRVNTLDTSAGGAPLTEAESLLRLAQQRLVLARDTAAAIDLFRAADELLRTIEDPAVFGVRETLAREVAALQALPIIDVPGIFARLGAQSERVAGFAVVAEATVQDFTVGSATRDATAESGWWNSVKQTLGEYFVVTRSGADVLPQLGAAEQSQLRTLVQVQIEQARLALLRADPQLYRRALDDALSTSRRWLRGEGNSFNDFIATLEMLRDTPIVADIPVLDETLGALRQLTGNAAAPAVGAP